MKQVDSLQDINIDDLSTIESILNGTCKDIVLTQLERFDNIIDQLGLDKERATYFENSRKYLP